ncbi:HlyD family secretion protein [Fodinibius sp. Rm-B-1B1-1]|uniref:HlyD family secretion protein n=1 Tax=Fodinibius alkaliphilus TaxID=3140241 RepID=UPI00315AE598
MPNHLFPKEIIDNSAEANFHKHTVKTKLIYTTIVLFIIGALASLPFISVDVSVRSQGVITSLTERNQLTSLVSGKINKLYIRENEPIKKGEKVAEIASPLIQEKLFFNTQRQQKIDKYLKDLSTLQSIDSASVYQPIDLGTAKYQRSFLAFKQQIQRNSQKITKAKRKFQRDKQLYNNNMLSEAEYEQTSFTLEAAQNEFDLLLDQQLNEWQSEAIAYQEELDQLKSEEEQLKREQEQYIIRAPIAGTVQNLQGIYEGSFVSPNQTLATISPDTGLIAESYVPPKDIGLIREGMKARMQISAFDYNQWGILTGKVKEISNDVSVINEQPVFIVRSVLDQSYLELQNGYRGQLKKGMTMQTRFTISERSLFQLLYDNVDDWLNPNWNNQNPKTAQASM